MSTRWKRGGNPHECVVVSTQSRNAGEQRSRQVGEEAVSNWLVRCFSRLVTRSEHRSGRRGEVRLVGLRRISGIDWMADAWGGWRRVKIED